MNPWLATTLIALFAAGLLLAELGQGKPSVMGVLLMLGTAAASLSVLSGAWSVAWAIGPAVASIILPHEGQVRRLTFEALVVHAAVVISLIAVATWSAIQLHVGDIPWPVLVLLLNVGGTGLAWIAVPRGASERDRGTVLAIAGGGVLLLALGRAGFPSAAAVGVLAALPALRQYPISTFAADAARRARLAYAGLAVVAVVFALSGRGLTGSLVDLPFSLDGLVPVGLFVVLAGAAVLEPKPLNAVVLVSMLALALSNPAVRWAALATVVSLVLRPERPHYRLAWGGIALFWFSAVAGSVLLPVSFVAHALPVSLVTAWLLLAGDAVREQQPRVLALPLVTFYLLMTLISLSADDLPRFQVMAAAGAMVLVVTALAASPERTGRVRTQWLRDRFGLALLLVAAAAPRLGVLAAVILLVDLAIVQSGLLHVAATGNGFGRVLPLLARSGWPPAAAFAGRALAIMAATEVNLLLGLLGAALVFGLQLAPLLGGAPVTSQVNRHLSSRDWAIVAISIACGLFPSVVSRALRLGS